MSAMYANVRLCPCFSGLGLLSASSVESGGCVGALVGARTYRRRVIPSRMVTRPSAANAQLAPGGTTPRSPTRARALPSAVIQSPASTTVSWSGTELPSSVTTSFQRRSVNCAPPGGWLDLPTPQSLGQAWLLEPFERCDAHSALRRSFRAGSPATGTMRASVKCSEWRVASARDVCEISTPVGGPVRHGSPG
jgi:hypothetical protein